MRKHIKDNATTVLDQEVYADGYERLKLCYNATKDKLDELRIECETRKAKRVNIDRFMAELRKRNILFQSLMRSYSPSGLRDIRLGLTW
ncbi:MAG: hypothetical protein PHE51_04275 [Eubacteriales bacterium]|nr:hypothetical protein [Eubacteriales bacterium]